MTSLKDIKLKQAYDSDRDNLLDDFYIPAMSTGVKYKRIAGFFSSGILSAAARGIAEFIQNNGVMQLIIGFDIHEEDYEAMQKSLENPDRYVLEQFEKNFDEMEQFLREDKAEALGWMLANNKMEIKIGLAPNGGLFHLKVGIIEDEYGNKISFSGSDNETPSAWKHNIEEFKVFKSWIDGEDKYFQTDEDKFNRFWFDMGVKAKIVGLPEAIRNKLIKHAPKNKEDLRIFKKERHEINKTDVDSGKRSVLEENTISATSNIDELELRKCQKEALEFWDANQNRGIFAMATGAGKTKTALVAANSIFKKHGECCTIIAVPQLYLATQWVEDDIRGMFPDAVIIQAHSEAPEWRSKLNQVLSDFGDQFYKQVFIVTLYTTLSSDDFLTILERKMNPDRKYMLIADEMHNLGATKNSRGMIKTIDIRLGLSATPARYFDESGTKELEDYFGKTYEYSIAEAIRDGILVPYEYYPVFVEMTDNEFQEYAEISEKIKKNNFRGADSVDSSNKEFLEFLYRERVKIIKKSENKLHALEDIVIELKKDNKFEKLLIYCDSIEQVTSSQEILNKEGIFSHKITERESMNDRKKIIDSFSNNNYDTLVAVKILDEGINIPSVHTAIIMASSTNPREYIQRRGRVLRKSPGKEKAFIYDFIVLPPSQFLEGDLKKIEQNILQREIQRVQDFYNTADNKSYVMNKLIDKMNEFGVYFK